MKSFGFSWIKPKTAWRATAPSGIIAVAALMAGLFSGPAFCADCAMLNSLVASDAEKQAAHDRIIGAGFVMGSEFLWEHHYAVYWDLTQRTYREEMNPGFDGALEAGVAFCQPGMPYCDADYDDAQRPQEVKDAVAREALTGRIGKP